MTLLHQDYSATLDRNWTVVSTTPQEFFNSRDISFETQAVNVFCDIDNNGFFTMWLDDGSRYSFNPNAAKYKKAYTCTAEPNSDVGEWMRSGFIDPHELQGYERWILRPDEALGVGVDNASQHMVIYNGWSSHQPPPIFFYGLFDRFAYAHVNKIDFRDLTHVALGGANTSLEHLNYGDGQMFAILKSGPPIPVPDMDQYTFDRTLVYFPFKYPFRITSTPQSTVSTPWKVECQERDGVAEMVTLVAKGKLYFICMVGTPGTHYEPATASVQQQQQQQQQPQQIISTIRVQPVDVTHVGWSISHRLAPLERTAFCSRGKITNTLASFSGIRVKLLDEASG
ncbi:hypothetical protein BG004_000865 [Podila humilis]|nr:hypothetical protein BG004_000865 [Podila humilis]